MKLALKVVKFKYPLGILDKNFWSFFFRKSPKFNGFYQKSIKSKKMAFDWCMNCYILLKKKFWSFLSVSKNIRNFYLCIYIKIHTPIESPYRVVTKYVDLENICIDLPVKKFKKNFKINTFEKSGFGV